MKDKVNTQTIVRTAVLLLALVNQVLVVMGKQPLPIEDEGLSAFLTTALTAIASIWAWWKNNSFTKPAIEADKILKQKKNLLKSK